jgi:hypothetical protein
MDDNWIHQWAGKKSPERNSLMALTYFYALFQRGPKDFAILDDDDFPVGRCFSSIT